MSEHFYKFTLQEPSAAVHSSVASKSASSTTLAEVDASGDVWSLVFQSFAQTAQRENETKSKAAGSKEDKFVAMTKQLDEYLGLPLQNRLANPLRWWKDHAERFPYLAKLARKYQATPASSVYSERLFSEYGNIFEEKRARLLPKTGEKLLFLHHNIKRLHSFLSLYVVKNQRRRALIVVLEQRQRRSSLVANLAHFGDC